MQRESGYTTAIAGTSQSGKTSKCKEWIAGVRRLMVFDPRAEYRDCNLQVVGSLRELNNLSLEKGPGRYAYTPGDDIVAEFDMFCRIAYSWTRVFPGAIVVDELAQFTNAGKAIGAWGTLTRMGKHFGAHIYGITQFPTESDRTIWRNADRKVAFLIEGDDDQVTLARALAISRDQLPTERFHYVIKLTGQADVMQFDDKGNQVQTPAT